MGYTTEFNGGFDLTPAPTEEQVNYINTFSSTRRMKRNPEILMETYGGKYGLNGNYGNDGEYFCKDDGDFGQTNDESVIDSNTPPGQLTWKERNSMGWEEYEKWTKENPCQPGLWCQWIIEEGKLQWDEGEKFYKYVEWLEYMIEHFFGPWGIQLNGEVEWRGEDWNDTGTISIIDNQIFTKQKA